MIKFETKISDDSYSVAVASMAEQVLEDLLETLGNIDPSEVQIEGLRKIEFEREGRMKRILDLASIIYDPTVSKTAIRVAMKELKDKDLVIANMRMAGYKNMSPGPDEGNFFVELPKPTASDLGSFENQIKMTQDRAISKMGKVNFDAASRMKAAVNSEFIEPRVTMLARKQIEKISDETYRHIKVFCMVRRQALVGGSMRLTEDDEMVTYRRMKDEIYNFVHEKLGK